MTEKVERLLKLQGGVCVCVLHAFMLPSKSYCKESASQSGKTSKHCISEPYDTKVTICRKAAPVKVIMSELPDIT